MVLTPRRWLHHCTDLLSCWPQRKRTYSTVFFLAVYAFASSINFAKAQQVNPSRVLLEGFWWNYRNDLYKKPTDGANNSGRWSNYLAELSPRLAALGIDAVWVPPNLKTDTPNGIEPDGTETGGYNPFDHYDLGDKFQKNSTITKMGTKDELLRMVALMHANGIDVIQDMIFNHMGAAGPEGLDPGAMTFNGMNNQRMKTFRYVCYGHPGDDGNPDDYLSRPGRFPKNWENFHPNPHGHPTCPPGDVTCTDDFGPDICYHPDAFGFSSTNSSSTFNFTEVSNWMHDSTSQWVKWYKKQVDFDGVRLDDVKQVESSIINRFVNDMQNNADWASGGQQMFAVGEWVSGDKAELDMWVKANALDVAGTFDFSLRAQIHKMVNGMGFYPMKDIVNFQQDSRSRTVPFVNNHDTFRPKLDPNGNYPALWDVSNELGGGDFSHIDPRDPRMAAAYAIICAVDGSPQIFFEDLFDLNNGTRFNHKAGDLKWRPEIATIIWAHQAMNWKARDAGQNYLYPYKVRTSPLENPLPFFPDPTFDDNDMLVIERQGRAIIAINDNGTRGGSVWVNSGFSPNTTLFDYGPSSLGTTVVQNDQRVQIFVPKVDPSQSSYGYAIWAPIKMYDQNTPFKPAQRQTTQEWEMRDDMGDSHPNSLGQGGTIPTSYSSAPMTGPNMRYVGRIYAEGGTDILIQAFPATHFCFNMQILNEDGTSWGSSGGSNWKDCGKVSEPGNPPNEIDIKYTAKETGWYYISAVNINAGAQKIRVKATYQAPTTVDTSKDKEQSYPPWVMESATVNNSLFSLDSYPNPTRTQITLKYMIAQKSHVGLSLFSLMGEKMATVEDGYLEQGSYEKKVDLSRLPLGMYICKMKTDMGETSTMIQIGN